MRTETLLSNTISFNVSSFFLASEAHSAERPYLILTVGTSQLPWHNVGCTQSKLCVHQVSSAKSTVGALFVV